MSSAYFYRRASSAKKQPTSAPRPAIVATADVFTHLVQSHQKLRAVFLKETARKNN
jgi:hypothetical protein